MEELKIMLGGQTYQDDMDEAKEAKRKDSEGCVEKAACFKTRTIDDLATKFDWCNNWLKGDEYYHILTHTDLYSRIYSFKKYPPKTHPPSTYTNPTSKGK